LDTGTKLPPKAGTSEGMLAESFNGGILVTSQRHLAGGLLGSERMEKSMTPTHQHTKRSATEFEADKKVFQEALQKARSEVTAADGEMKKLRAEMKTQTADSKKKTMDQVDEVRKQLDVARKQEQLIIEAHLKAVHADIEATTAELTHAGAAAKTAAEVMLKVMHDEYGSAKRSLIAAMDAELAELKARIDDGKHQAAELKSAVKSAVDAKIAHARSKHEAAHKELQSLKRANAAAFNEVHHGVQSAMSELKTALEHARAEIAKAS